MSTQKTLYILRHAKAEHGSAQQDDHERGIIDVGVQAAKSVGLFMKEESIILDKVLCSNANRARMTWDMVCDVYHTDTATDYQERLYLASMNELLGLIALTDEAVNNICIVGHNPGLHQLCLKLAKSGDAELLDTLSIKFPTCSFAEIELGATPWHDVQHMHGELKKFVTPSMLGGED